MVAGLRFEKSVLPQIPTILFSQIVVFNRAALIKNIIAVAKIVLSNLLEFLCFIHFPGLALFVHLVKCSIYLQNFLV